MIDVLFPQEVRQEWAEKIIHCSYCEFEGKLEINDRFLSCHSEHFQFVGVKCPNCRHVLRVAEI